MKPLPLIGAHSKLAVLVIQGVQHHIGSCYSCRLRFPGLNRKFKKNNSLKKYIKFCMQKILAFYIMCVIWYGTLCKSLSLNFGNHFHPINKSIFRICFLKFFFVYLKYLRYSPKYCWKYVDTNRMKFVVVNFTCAERRND